MRIEEIDPNLKVESAFGLTDVVFADVRKDPFDLYGFYAPKTEPVFRRMPDDIAAAVNPGVRDLSKHTAGGRVRFSTDSAYIAIRCKMNYVTHFPHMTLCGTSGFDLYETRDGKDYFVGMFTPPTDMKDGYSSRIETAGGKMRTFTIHFPMYNDVISLEIGLQKDAAVDHGAAYRPFAPVVYYGSSITQGGCASRPGNAYQNLISAHQNIDHINLGFSGSARGEAAMADYIADLDMSALVLDYDHNAPSAEHLTETYQPLFDKVRAKHPDLPILIVSKPDTNNQNVNIERRDVLYQTFLRAIRAGDRHVAFLDGYSLFGNDYRDACTVDGCHPNDAGFVRMAQAIGYELQKFFA